MVEFWKTKMDFSKYMKNGNFIYIVINILIRLIQTPELTSVNMYFQSPGFIWWWLDFKSFACEIMKTSNIIIFLYNNSSYFFRVLIEIWQLVLYICCYFVEMIRLENLNSNIAVLMILFKFRKGTLISNAYRIFSFIMNKNTILKLI